MRSPRQPAGPAGDLTDLLDQHAHADGGLLQGDEPASHNRPRPHVPQGPDPDGYLTHLCPHPDKLAKDVGLVSRDRPSHRHLAAELFQAPSPTALLGCYKTATRPR
ncbi:hypothetical protein [Streptomyces sp. NPDC002785]|uniref:hypothetical protein n=1 Tax=Streptomyces sp. NPDC002785 TaxID=3154543 RepID=UPI003321E9F5